MAFDGLTIACLKKELETALLGGRIDKIYQVEKDEILLHIRSLGKVRHLLLSAGASHARIQLTEKHYETPLTPPGFCMALRKHFSGGKILGIEQFHWDRIIALRIETLNELGDTVTKSLVLEMMGKHSNLMALDENGRIIDAIRHVSPLMSSVRVVQPGLLYELPHHNVKASPREAMEDGEVLKKVLKTVGGPLETAIYQGISGFSPFLAKEVIFRTEAQVKNLSSTQENGDVPIFMGTAMEEKPDSKIPGTPLIRLEKTSVGELTETSWKCLQEAMRSLMDEVEHGPYTFLIYGDRGVKGAEFAAVPLQMMAGVKTECYETLSQLMDAYYEKTDQVDRLKQKSQDLRHFLHTNLERINKKISLQEKQLQDTAGREKDRVMGDLITANLYQIQEGQTRAELINFYEESMPTVVVKLEGNLTPSQNAQKYYAWYNKQKRTEEALTEQLKKGREERAFFLSLLTAADLADCEQDIEDIREELRETGYLKKISEKTRKKKNLSKSKPLTFMTSEGVRGLIGKNNRQNDEVTMRLAALKDQWFHVKDMPGSHVILQVGSLEEGKDYTVKSLEEAAAVAALHSSAVSLAGGKESSGVFASNVPVDHTLRQYVKKPAGAQPGFVTYTHQETIYVKADWMENWKQKQENKDIDMDNP